MGCFWGAERKFWDVDGVFSTAVGYAGGHLENPNYEDVCSGDTGHAEIVRVVYDQRINNLEVILSVFWESHDPTQYNRQGNDIGSQYRSIILTKNEDELLIINQTKQKYQKNLTAQSQGVLKTEIKILSNFFLAEDYHQKYLHKNPNGYCGLKGLNIKYF
jgi:peptide-methionine (S)-S-oxide reductase